MGLILSQQVSYNNRPCTAQPSLNVAPFPIPIAQGTLTPYGPEFMLATPALTDSTGGFSLDASAPGLVAFPPGAIDTLMGASVKFWSVAPTSPGANVTVTPVASLVEAYRRLKCNTNTAACKPIGDGSLYSDVYSLFGFLPQPAVDFRSWSGIVMGSPYGFSIYVLNQRIASILIAASEVARTVCGDDFTASSNPSVQLAVQFATIEVLLAKPSAPDRIAALSSPDDIAAIMDLTLANLKTPEADLGNCSTIDAADAVKIFPVLAQVRWVVCMIAARACQPEGSDVCARARAFVYVRMCARGAHPCMHPTQLGGVHVQGCAYQPGLPITVWALAGYPCCTSITLHSSNVQCSIHPIHPSILSSPPWQAQLHRHQRQHKLRAMLTH